MLKRVISALTLVGVAGLASGQPLGTGFTYQGSLSEFGAGVSGTYDLRFRVFAQATGGAPIASELCANDVTVTGGTFTVRLDFGAVFAGQSRYLEIDVRADTGLGCGNTSGFVMLTPRQELTAAPNASYASTAGVAANATALNGQSSAFYQNAANLTSGTIPSARIGGTYSNVMNFSNMGNSYAGSGANLINLNASNISSGTLSFGVFPVPLILSGNAPGSAVLEGGNTSTAAFSSGVYGSSQAATGATFGVRGFNASTEGTGVYAVASAATGSTHGVWGISNSSSGSAVRGNANATTGTNYGGNFTSSSSGGTGVLGQATSTTGLNVGGRFTANGTVGTGAYGAATSSTGQTVGGWFETYSNEGVALTARSNSTALSTNTIAGDFRNLSSNGIGVNSIMPSTLGETIAGLFQVESTGGIGLVVNSNASTGLPLGMIVNVGAPNAIAIKASNTAATGNSRVMELTSSSNEGSVIYAWANGITGQNYGIFTGAQGTSGRGIFAVASSLSGSTFGGEFHAQSSSGTAVRGLATSTTGSAIGGWFTSSSLTGTGVRGETTNTGGVSFGGRFSAASSSGIAVLAERTNASGASPAIRGFTNSTTTGAIGIAGEVTSTNPGSSSVAIRGVNNGTSFAGYGIWGTHNGGGIGVYGNTLLAGVGVYGDVESGIGTVGAVTNSASSNYGVYGSEPSGSPGHAVYAFGTFAATGTKSFQIDHPLDPANKYLNHFCAEGPEPYNMYRGSITLDGQGSAVVTLPDYFSQINRDPTVSLTAVGGPMPMLHVAEEVSGNEFTIAGGTPGAKVHWRVEAIRDDRWMKAYGNVTPAEQVKDQSAKGRYIHPELYGMPASSGIIQLRGVKDQNAGKEVAASETATR